MVSRRFTDNRTDMLYSSSDKYTRSDKPNIHVHELYIILYTVIHNNMVIKQRIQSDNGTIRHDVF